MSDMDDMLAWFRACLDEDECDALDAKGYLSGVWTYVKTPGGDYKVIDDLGYSVSGHYDVDSEPWRTQPHIARFDPDRALREVKADRHIIAEYERVDRMVGEERGASFVRNELLAVRRAYRVAIAHRAAARSDQPGYQESWRP